MNGARPVVRAAKARALALACSALLACATGCKTERVEYQYRPGYMTDPNAPSEVTLPDGTKVIFVDKPVGVSTIESSRIRNPKPKVVKLGPDGKPIVPKQFEPREMDDDGKVVLRNLTMDHVVANTMECMRNEEYQLIWDQLLAPETKAAYEGQGGFEKFNEWCQANRRNTMELLNRMRFNVMGSEIAVDKMSNNRLIARVSPQLWEQFKLRVVEFRYTEDGMKLVTIRAQ